MFTTWKRFSWIYPSPFLGYLFWLRVEDPRVLIVLGPQVSFGVETCTDCVNLGLDQLEPRVLTQDMNIGGPIKKLFEPIGYVLVVVDDE